MASVFTYETDIPRVSSPWLVPAQPSNVASGPSLRTRSTSLRIPGTPPPASLADYNVLKLEPEPQEGPIEFKLHLLLRPRRVYGSYTTDARCIDSRRDSTAAGNSQVGSLGTTTPITPPAPSNQSRQHRLLQLTTQLLWRLQQSSPFHASSINHFSIPQLADSQAVLSPSSRPNKLLPGLEGSRGALYEIGVSDDGTFVGLTEDEMEESLINLRTMAFSLGCLVEITKMVVVGECEWNSAVAADHNRFRHREDLPNTKILRHQAKLYVAEALITPDLAQTGTQPDSPTPDTPNITCATTQKPIIADSLCPEDMTDPQAQQLRITLTGVTTSGKSSLLGTLSTGTLDNGRGKSRMSLLKHRHELATGQTSTIAQELFGYKSEPSGGVSVINYAAGAKSMTGHGISWNDIHSMVGHDRLVYVSDSAGHPKYRRTTVKGLVGWAPHWVVLCIAADDCDKASASIGCTSTAEDILGPDGMGSDLSMAHLDLCLALDKPLIIVITKFDLARSGLRQNLAKILTALKAAGRVPAMMPPDQTKTVAEINLESLDIADLAAAKRLMTTMNVKNLQHIVPIVMTSSLKGTGVKQLHSLLHSLPLPSSPTSRDYVSDALNPEQPAALFHVEDVFGVPASFCMQTTDVSAPLEAGTVIAGHMRFGRLSVGEKVVIGPFPGDLDEAEVDFFPGSTRPFALPIRRKSTDRLSRSAPSTQDLRRLPQTSARHTPGEWHNAHIVSIRNLRLPSQTLSAGQVGTIGIVFDLSLPSQLSSSPLEQSPTFMPRLRKGQVLALPSAHMLQTGLSLQAASGFVARFDNGDVNSNTIGSLVLVYVASVRASARIVRIDADRAFENSSPGTDGPGSINSDSEDDVFGLDDTRSGMDGPGKDTSQRPPPSIFGKDGATDVTLELMTQREWIELGSQVLIMPGGGSGYGGKGDKSVIGLEGFVGRVIEVVE